MLTTGNDEYAIYKAADVLYRHLADRGVYKSVTSLAYDLTRNINELKDKSAGWYIGGAGWHMIRLVENNLDDEYNEAHVYIGLNVLEYFPYSKHYHLIDNGHKEWEYFETPEISEEDQSA